MTAPTWQAERTDVLKSLALLGQLGTDTRADIARLEGALRDGIATLADRDSSQQDKLDSLEIKVATRGVKSNGQREDVRELHNRVGEIEKLMPTVRIVMGVGALLGASVVALIWSLITGQANIVF